MKTLLTVVSLTVVVLIGSVRNSFSADYIEGHTAARNGNYATALREFRALAEQGSANAQYSLGLMDESIWQSKQRVMLGNFARCGNPVYLQRKQSLDQRLVKLINDAMPDDCLHKDR